MFGKFLFDDEQCQFERSDFVGELKQGAVARLVKTKDGTRCEQTQSTEIGGMEMQ